MYALLVKDETGNTVVEHVSNYADDTVHVPYWSDYGLQQSEYRKAHHLLSEIQKDHPEWKVYSREFKLEELIPEAKYQWQ